jgi:hypothetical protein
MSATHKVQQFLSNEVEELGDDYYTIREDVCNICQESRPDLDAADAPSTATTAAVVNTRACQHFFHSHCLKVWLTSQIESYGSTNNKATCSMCQHVLIQPTLRPENGTSARDLRILAGREADRRADLEMLAGLEAFLGYPTQEIPLEQLPQRFLNLRFQQIANMPENDFESRLAEFVSASRLSEYEGSIWPEMQEEWYRHVRANLGIGDYIRR